MTLNRNESNKGNMPLNFDILPYGRDHPNLYVRKGIMFPGRRLLAY